MVAIPYPVTQQQRNWLVQMLSDFLSLLRGEVATGQRFTVFLRLAIFILSSGMISYTLITFYGQLFDGVLVISPPLTATFGAGVVGLFLANPRLRSQP